MDVQVTEFDDLDTVWTQYSGQPVTFHYAPGLYQTKGWQWTGLKTAQPNQAHLGSGIGKTVIQLVGVTPGTSDGAIFGSDWQWVNNFKVQDMTLDLNTSIKATAGIGIWGGSNISITRVEFINFGSPVLGKECFPCYVFGPPRQVASIMQNIVFDSCVLRLPITGNKDGCSMMVMNETPPSVVFGSNCVIQNCRFLDCRSDFSYLHCTGAPTVLNNIAVNSGEFFYLEPHNSPVWQDTGINIHGNTVVGGESLFSSSPGNGGSIASMIRIS